MDKLKSVFQFVAKPWYKARDFIAGHPNVALISGIVLVVLLVLK